MNRLLFISVSFRRSPVQTKGTPGGNVNIDLARQMVLVDFKVSRDLQEVLQALKAGCPPNEYRELARGIAAAVDGVGTALLGKAIEAHPQLEAEIDASIKQYGYYRDPSRDLTDR